jgi:hypothetical protein
MDNLERQELIMRHMPLVNTLVRDLLSRRPRLDGDELRSAGYQALCEGADQFVPSDEHVSGASFGTFIRSRIIWAIDESVRLQGLIRIPKSKRDTIKLYRSEVEIEDYGTMPAELPAERDEMLALVESALAACPEPGRTIWALCRGLDGEPPMTMADACARTGLSKYRAVKAFADAAFHISNAVRAKGWTEETWAEALAG